MRLWPRPWRSLSSEITLVYASLSISLVVLLSYIVFQMNSRVLEEGIRRELLLTVDQTLHGINAEIEERVGEVQTLTLVPSLRAAANRSTELSEALHLQEATDTEVATALSRVRSDPTGSSFMGVDAFLADFKENHPYVSEVLVTDRYGINAATSHPTTDVRQDDESWWHEAVLQHFHLSNLQYDEATATYGYSIALPIPDDPRPPLGVVKAELNLRAIQDLVNSVALDRGGYLVVISRDGRVLSHPDATYLYRPIGEVPSLAPVAGVITTSLRGVSEFELRESGKDDSRWLVGYSRVMRPASLGPLNWTVAAVVSRDEVFSPVQAVRNSAIVAGLGFILAAVPIVFAVSKRLSRPLVDLAQRADRISQGDLNVSLSVPSSDEIGRLASALGTMVDNLKSTHRRTLDINARLEKVVRDRTEELQRKNRQIEAQNKRVTEASRLKSQFLANMSHELRTPLNAVLALSEILSNEMSGPLNPEQRKQATIINRSGKSLLRLINDVLDLSKIEAGRMSVEKAPMSLHTLINMVADTLRPLAEDKRLSVAVNMTPDVPEFMTSDEHKLRQILINLVGNAIKFTERGGVRIEVSHPKSPPSVSIAVKDTGIGIAPEMMDRVFDEFCQGDGSTTRKYGGTGLGLTISRRMAELMGGTLTVRSTPTVGSTFTLTVPFVASAPVPATAAETLKRVRMQVPEPALMSTADDSSTAMNDPRPIVLVADDELDNLYVMKKYLNRHGCQAIFSRDGSEVLEKAKRYKPIAITLDLVLPKKSGWDVLSELKTDPQTRSIPVIIASVLDNQERGFCLGAYRYLVKPINETDLADTIYQIQCAERKNVKRVLIIDDSVVDADLTARLLAESKYDVLRASSGEDGIATAALERPDLILLDLSMPGMNGFQVIDGLRRREETRGIPVIIYTAKDLTPEERARLDRGAQKVFLKNPLEPSRMLAEIGELLKTQSPDESPTTIGEPAWQATVSRVEEAARGARESTAKILIVEDDPANQYTLEFMLRREGYEVVMAENGRDGIEKVSSVHPDIILMDMMMPVMGGHEATKVLKDTPGAMDIPVIALTAGAMTGDREKALAAGCDDYVSKPVERDILLGRIEHWVSKIRAAQRRATGADSPPDQPPRSD